MRSLTSLAQTLFHLPEDGGAGLGGEKCASQTLPQVSTAASPGLRGGSLG